MLVSVYPLHHTRAVTSYFHHDTITKVQQRNFVDCRKHLLNWYEDYRLSSLLRGIWQMAQNGMTRPGKAGGDPRVSRSRSGRLNHSATETVDRGGGGGGVFVVVVVVAVVVVCWLLNVPATCYRISGTDPLGQVYVLPHRDRRCRSNFLPHPVTVY